MVLVGGRWEEVPGLTGVGMGGVVRTHTQGKDPHHPGMWEGDRPGRKSHCWREELEPPLLGFPGPCPPDLYQGLRHSTGTRVGRQGLEKSPLPGRDAAPLLPHSPLPFTSREGGGSCQRKWGRIKASRKGQGQVRGPPPKLGACQPPRRETQTRVQAQSCRGPGPLGI